MQEQLTMVNPLIRNQEVSDVSVYGGHIQIPSLKKDVPDDVANLTRVIYNVLPRIKLTELENDDKKQLLRFFCFVYII
nr:hypothetical protein [Bacillus thuringiensis]